MLSLLTKAQSNPPGTGIARAVAEVFRQQESVASPNTFRRWDSRLAAALLEPTFRVMRNTALEEVDDDDTLVNILPDLRAAAQARAQESAASVNATSLELEDPFSVARASSIGFTEAAWAANVARAIAAKAEGNKFLVWQCSAKCCKACRSLDGKRVKIGQVFKSGNQEVLAPPLHPNCKCKVKGA